MLRHGSVSALPHWKTSAGPLGFSLRTSRTEHWPSGFPRWWRRRRTMPCRPRRSGSRLLSTVGWSEARGWARSGGPSSCSNHSRSRCSGCMGAGSWSSSRSIALAMRPISSSRTKRDDCLRDRHLDFARAGEIFELFHMNREDDRQDYGEVRVVTLGRMDRKIVVCVWTERAGRRRIISLREAEPDEREIYNFHRP